MIYPNLNTGLEIPGLPDDLRARISALMKEIFDAYADNRSFPRLHEDKQQVNEPQYLQRLTETDDDEKRHEIMNRQISTRLNLVFSVLKIHQHHSVWLGRIGRLATCVKELRTLIADLPKEHPLVGFTLAMAGMLRGYCWPDPDEALKELDDVKGLTADRALEALLTVFNDVKAGGDTFTELNRFTFSFLGGPHVINIADAEGPRKELIEALIEGAQAFRSFIEPKRQFHSAKASLNRPQFAARLEEALQGPVDDRRYTPFDEVKKQQEDAEASYYAAIEHVKLWYANLVKARKRVSAALATALEELELGNDIWTMKAAFGEGSEVSGYKHMINCIAAASLLEQIAGFEADYQKIESDFADTNLDDPVEYIDKALAGVA